MIRNAIISVSDKKNIEPLVKFLYSIGTTIYSTRSTYKYLDTIAHEKRSLYRIEDLTQNIEFLDNSIELLHSKVIGGIIADQNDQQHMYELKSLDIPPIDLVVCNFDNETNSNNSEKGIIYNIGGQTIIRSAIKNYYSTYVLTSPIQYNNFIETVKGKSVNSNYLLKYKRELAKKAFYYIIDNDKKMFNYF